MDNHELLNAIAELLAKELGQVRDEMNEMKCELKAEIKELNAKVGKLEVGQEQMRKEMKAMYADLSGQIADGVTTLSEYFGEEISKIDRKVSEADAIAMRALRETALLSSKKI